MASPPFNITQTSPASSDFISTYPTDEQSFRDIVESWFLTFSTTSGVLLASAMPAVFGVGEVFDTTLYVDAANTTADSEIVFRDEADVAQVRFIWDESEDVFKLITYQDDGTTPRNTLVIANDAATFTYNTSNVLTAASTDAAAITGTGALNAGSITSGFGSIDIGADALTAGAASFTTGAFSSAVTMATTLAVTGAATFSATLEIGHASDTTLSRASAGVIAVEGVNLYPSIPVTNKSAAYTAVLADANTGIRHPASDNNARTFTIPANASVAYPIGTVLTFLNEINTVTIAINSDTLVFAPDGTTVSRTLEADGMATAWKVDTTRWYISGVGLS
jgi:hypothetical protein